MPALKENEVEIVKVDQYKAEAISRLISGDYFKHLRGKKTIAIKPNWTLDKSKSGGGFEQIITHGEVISAVINKLVRALDGGSRIVIAEGPDPEAQFNKIISHFPVDNWRKTAKRKKIDFEIIDLRDEIYLKSRGVILRKRRLNGDPAGATTFNLKGKKSEFYKHQKSKRGYYGTEFDQRETNKSHNGRDNLYVLSNTPLKADFVINMPKLKTHKKTGLTGALKNMVGITQMRNLLPQHSEGTPDELGDQFPPSNKMRAAESNLLAAFKKTANTNKLTLHLSPLIKKLGEIIFGETSKTIRSGNWYGNDTAWRMVLDLNKIFLYCSKDLRLKKKKRQRQITIMDAIIAGEGNGPLEATKKKVGYCIIGKNPVAVDTVCAHLMGFNFEKIPMIRNSYAISEMPLCNFKPQDIIVKVGGKSYRLDNIPKQFIKKLEPHFGWKGHIEK